MPMGVGQALKASPEGGSGRIQSRPTAEQSPEKRPTWAGRGTSGHCHLPAKVTFGKLAFSSLIYKMGVMIAAA